MCNCSKRRGFACEAKTWINHTAAQGLLCHSGVQNDFNDEAWMVCGKLSCTFHCQKPEVPHARSWTRHVHLALRVDVCGVEQALEQSRSLTVSLQGAFQQPLKCLCEMRLRWRHWCLTALILALIQSLWKSSWLQRCHECNWLLAQLIILQIVII